MFSRLREANPHLSILEVTDRRFSAYGRVVEGYDHSQWLEIMGKREIPLQGNCYIANDQELLDCPVAKDIQQGLYGGAAIQVGYCNGNNRLLNALEYHKSSEVNVAVTDLILLLGDVREIADNRYPSNQVEAFYLPAGVMVEVYATTLHFSPCCATPDGFRCMVILPAGTNLPLEEAVIPRNEEDALLFRWNKWLIGHEDSPSVQKMHAFCGITGENLEVYPV